MTDDPTRPAALLARRRALAGASALVAALGSPAAPAQAATNPPPASSGAPLASWNDGPAKQAVLDFVRVATDPSGGGFVPAEDRVATFDQDGTLWVEHPLYTQAAFALHRVHALAPQHPEWRHTEPFRAVLSGDPAAVGKLTERDWFVIVTATHSGMTTDAFEALAGAWLETARDSRWQRPFSELVYQPMREVMEYLRAHGFLVYIVTGGGQDFVRLYSQRVYGVAPEQVVGSVIETKYQPNDGKPVLMRLPKVAFIDDGPGKAIAIDRVIGRRPCAAFGNSDGDREMLEWAGANAGFGATLRMLVHHDDAQREYAYGPAGGLPATKVGTFSEALMAKAHADGWSVISMRNDWKRMFAFDG